MQNEFAAFDKKLRSMLADSASTNVGVKIQLERYHRDRVGNLTSTFRKARLLDEKAFDAECEIYLQKTSQPAQDYGTWGETAQFLEFLALTSLSYSLKSCAYFEAACLAAQQIESGDFDYSDIPYLNEFIELFAVENNCIVLSSAGYLNEKYGFTKLVQLRSIAGKIEVKHFESEQPSFHSYADVSAKISEYNWELTNARKDRLLNANDKFKGVSEFELKAYFYSNHAQSSWQDFVSEVYPVYQPNSLGLTISLHCNASCGHCYNASGLNRSKTCLTWKQMEKELRQWKSVGVNEVGISGGEPFLFASEVTQIVKCLRDLNVERIVPFSNGFWGEDPEKARSILIALKDAGFGSYPGDQVKISYGEFHKTHIGFKAVLEIAKLHAPVIGTKLLLDVEDVTDNGLINQLVREAKEAGVAQLIEWRMRKSFSNSGRARQWYNSMPSGEEKISNLRCPVGNRAAIYPDQSWVYCTGTVFPKHFLSLGKLGKSSVYFKLAKTQLSFRTVYLQFGTFGDYAKDHAPELIEKLNNVALKNSTPCSYCPKVFAHKSMKTQVSV